MNDDFMSLESCLKRNNISLNVAKTHKMLNCSKYKQRAVINSNEKPEIKVKDENVKVAERQNTFEYKLIKTWNGRNILCQICLIKL